MLFIMKSIPKKILASLLAFSIFASPIIQNIPSFGEVIDGQDPEHAMIDLSEVFVSISSGNEMDYDGYRVFFRDYQDTAAVLIKEFEVSKNQLTLVSDRLLEFEENIKKDLSSYDLVNRAFENRKDYYLLIKDAIMNSGSSTELDDGTILYTLKGNNNADWWYELSVKSDGAFTLFHTLTEKQIPIANFENSDIVSVRTSNDVTDFTMFSGTTSKVFHGTLDEDFNKNGSGVLYMHDGSINAGKWIQDELSGYAYIYDGEKDASNVIQFKAGVRHGMAIFATAKDDDLSTKIYKNGSLEGMTFSEYDYGDYKAQLMNYYENNKKLPLMYVYYPETGDKRLIFEQANDENIEIYISEKYDRTFIGNFSSGSLSGFGYGLIEDIEYIGEFDAFNVLGTGSYYKLEEEESKFDTYVDKAISDLIKPDMTQKEKIMEIHNHLVDKIDYHMPDAKIDNHPGYTHTAYGAVVYGSAVCDGYAQSFKVFLDRLDIENHLIFGITANSKGVFKETNRHAWNLVKIDDDYLHFDLTWNDPTFQDTIDHTYYYMTTKQIKKDHKWVEEDYAIYLNPESLQSNSNEN